MERYSLLILTLYLFGVFGCRQKTQDEIVKDADSLELAVDSLQMYPKCIPLHSNKGINGCLDLNSSEHFKEYGMFFFRISGDLLRPKTAIMVKVNQDNINITNRCQSYTLPMDGISVEYQVSREHPDSIYFYYCNDVPRLDVGTPLSYAAYSGELRVASSIDTVTSQDDFFRISAELLDVRFNLENDLDTLIKSIRFNEVLITEY